MKLSMKNEGTISIPFQVRERSGVNIQKAIISNGIPLPIGKVFDASALSLYDTEGKLVEAGFYPLQKWQDGSWRFVLVNFLTNLTPNSVHNFALVVGQIRQTENKILIDENETCFQVVTGPLKLEISKQNFNGINRAWLDNTGLNNFNEDTLMVDSHKYGITARIGGIEYTSYAGKVKSALIERQDEVQAVIKVEGKLGFVGSVQEVKNIKDVTNFEETEDNENVKDPKNLKNVEDLKLDYKVWIKAWAGSSEVEITFNVANKEGTSFDQYLKVERISLEIPLKKPEGLTYSFGGKNGIHEGNVDSQVCIYQETSDSYQFINEKTESKTVRCGKSDKCTNTGWVDIRSGSKGIGAVYRWFWQTYPSAISVSQEGVISVQVWPSQHEPLKLYTGVAKTTDIRLYLHDSSENIQTVGDRLKAFQKITAATAPPSWYCQDTKAVDTRLVDLDPETYPESERDFIKRYNEGFDNAFKKLLDDRDFNKNYAPGEDGYGFMNFGDGWEYANDMNPPVSSEVTWWGNNYYDHPHCFFIQFFRTGNLEYLEYALQHTYHIMDIDTANYDPVKGMPGNYKQCPGVMHIKRYTNPYVNENGVKDYVFGGCDGHWHFQGVESLFEAYYTFGINPALERALEAVQLPLAYNTLNFTSETRSIGHTLDGLAAAYRHTWDEKYLEGMNQVWNRVRKHAFADHGGIDSKYPYRPEYKPYVYVRNTPFQTGILLGGVYKYRCFSPFVTGEDGIDTIACNTISCDIWGRYNEATGENSGWLEDEKRWKYNDVMTVSAGWLNSIFPQKGFLRILKKTCENCIETKFADRVKTFSQSFKYQWLTHFELAKDSVKNRLFASFTAFPRKIKAGETVTFNNQSLGMATCLWNFGDNETLESTAVNVRHVYSKPGIYDVSILIQDASGMEEQFSIKSYIEVL